jgi:hypothetical protein
MDDELRSQVIRRAGASAWRTAYEKQAAYVAMRQAARELVARGITDGAELARVLGLEE